MSADSYRASERLTREIFTWARPRFHIPIKDIPARMDWNDTMGALTADQTYRRAIARVVRYTATIRPKTVVHYSLHLSVFTGKLRTKVSMSIPDNIMDAAQRRDLEPALSTGDRA